MNWKWMISEYYYKRLKGNRGLYVLNEPWDYLLILDACRFDHFQEVNTITGQLKPVISRGSSTKEWALENFQGRACEDILYINGNPVIDTTLPPDSFFKLVSVWRHGWSPHYQTVLPYTLAEEARKQIKRNPGKRCIIHFIQPHYPFINTEEFDFDTCFGSFKKEKNGKELWEQVKVGRVDLSRLKAAYNENLKKVLEVVRLLLPRLKGKVVISSDHGNLYGQFLAPFPIRAYGHPPGIYHKDLVRVPWLEVKNENL